MKPCLIASKCQMSILGGLLFLVSSTAFAQVKIGTNPTSIDPNSNLEVEASTPARKLSVNKTTGQLTLKDGTEADGRVLTSDGNGNASWTPQATASDVNFFASFQGLKPVADDPTTKIDFDAANPNVGNGYDTATDQFVAPLAGIYYFVGTAYIHDSGIPGGTPRTVRDVLSIKVNGTAKITQENFQYQVAYGNAFSVCLVTRLQAGDSVELFGFTDKTTAFFAGLANSINAPQTTFQGFLIGK